MEMLRFSCYNVFGNTGKACVNRRDVEMEMRKKKLPIGIDNFEKLCTEDFYYIDKTGFIKELLDNWGEVNLFTRPRRFGKTLNMSMLEHFFSMEIKVFLRDWKFQRKQQFVKNIWENIQLFLFR